MITESETLALLKRMADGNEAAARQFYIAYRPILRSFLSRGGYDSVMVEDTLQEVMVEVWKHPDRFRQGQGASFKTWLLSIAQFRLIDQIRKKKIPTEELSEEIAGDAEDDGYAAVHSLDRRTAVTHCKEKLKGKHRQLLTLAYEHDLTGQEIAKVMDMPEGTVKSALHYARNLIRDCVERMLGGAFA